MKYCFNTSGLHAPVRQTLLSATAASALLLSAAAYGQTQSAQTEDTVDIFTIEEIVVTARKRSESLQSVPMAISAFDGKMLQERGMNKVSDIGKFVPNLNITRFGAGNPSATGIFIRGIGIQDHIITTDPGVSLYVDGVYLGRQMGSNLNLVNIERVEVLRGPQGTLYGRNSIGGAINIITEKPGDEEVFEFGIRGGSRFRAEANFYANFNLSEDVSMSASGFITRRDGVGKALRIVNPTREIGEIFEAAGRFAIDWEVSDDFNLLFSFDANQGEHGQSPSTAEIIPGLDQPGAFADSGFSAGFFTDPIGPAVDLPGGPLKASDIATADPDDTNTSVERLLKQSNTGIGTSVTANYQIDENFSTKVLASFRHMDYAGGLDDETAFQDFQSFPETGEADQVSVEAQLNGEFDRFDFVTGVYYFREEGDTFSGPNTFIAPGGFFDINQTTKSFAVYGHGGYQVTPDLKISGGVRWTTDDKDADALFSNWPVVERVFREDDWNEVTWDASITYDITDRLTVFYQESKGYQNGGFPARPFGGPETFVSFDPVTARNHEGGIKGTPFSFMRTALSVFFTEYDGLPLQFSQTTEDGFVTITETAQSESFGVEWENTLQFGGFSLNTSVGWIDAEVQKVPEGAAGLREGDDPALTPEWTISVSPSYEHFFDNGDSLLLRADYSFRDSMFGQSLNNELNQLESRELMNIRAEYTNVKHGWSIAFYGDNIWNEKYDVGRLDQPFSGFTEVILNNDRSEFGLQFTKTFSGF